MKGPWDERKRWLHEATLEPAGDLAELYPDPVDAFEDRVAEETGLVRHPGCELESWREARRRWIDGMGEGLPR